MLILDWDQQLAQVLFAYDFKNQINMEILHSWYSQVKKL
jgi:hypothetical protein